MSNSVDPVNVDNRSLAVYGSYYSDHGVAFSATLGRAIGVDATWQMWKRNYLTLSGSVGGAQGFVSHRAFNSPFLGIAVGAGYRYSRKFFAVEDLDIRSSMSLPTYKVLPVHSAGGTVSVVLRPGPEAPGVLLGHLYAGYAPGFKRPVITLGITAGFF